VPSGSIANARNPLALMSFQFVPVHLEICFWLPKLAGAESLQMLPSAPAAILSALPFLLIQGIFSNESLHEI